MATQINESMISEVSICNQALSWVGANQITSLTDPTTEAEWCRANYAFLRDAVLEECCWTFATERATSTTGNEDPWGIYYEHQLPLEWLYVFRVYCDTNETEVEWVREQEFVRAKAATIYMWGIKRITDTNKFSNLFVQTLAARIAADAAMFFTQNRNLQADLWALYQSKLQRAIIEDNRQGRNELERWNGLTLTARR